MQYFRIYIGGIWHVICLDVYVCGHYVIYDMYHFRIYIGGIWHVICLDIYMVVKWVRVGVICWSLSNREHCLPTPTTSASSSSYFLFLISYFLFLISFFLFLFSYFLFLFSYFLFDRQRTVSAHSYYCFFSSIFLFSFYLLSFIFYLWCIFISLSNREQCLPTPTTASSSPLFLIFFFVPFLS